MDNNRYKICIVLWLCTNIIGLAAFLVWDNFFDNFFEEYKTGAGYNFSGKPKIPELKQPKSESKYLTILLLMVLLLMVLLEQLRR